MKLTGILQKSIVRNTTTVLSGNIAAQAISLAIYPLLTRIYSPDDFGVLTLFLSIGGIWVILAGAEYYNSVLLAKDKQEAINCFQVSFLVILMVSLLCAVSILFKDPIAGLYKSESLGEFYVYLPVYVLFTALWVLFQHWYSRGKQFKAIGEYQVGLSLTNAGFKSGFGLAGLTTGGLIWSMTIAPVIALTVNISHNVKGELKKLFAFDRVGVKSAAKKYSNFPKYSTPRMLLNYIIGILPVLILTPFFSLEELGFFGLAVTLSQKPINMMVSSMYTVFFQKFSDMVREKQSILPALKKYILIILSFTIPAFIILYFILPWLTALLFGDEWRFTGELIRVMLAYLAAMMVTSTFNFIPDIFSKQKITLFFEIANLALSLCAIVAGIKLGDFHSAVFLLYQAYAVVWIIEGIWIVGLAKKYESTLK